MTEQELIQELKAGAEPAFRWLVENYRNRVYYTILNILQEPDEAEDAAQETFIQVYDSIQGFRGEASLSTWIYRIAVNKALEKSRKAKNRQRLQQWLPWWMPEEKKSEKASYLNPGIRAENKEKAQALFTAIQALPERQRLAFTLIQVQGMSYEEACSIMELGVKAMESLVSRAKESLRRKLNDYYHAQTE